MSSEKVLDYHDVLLRRGDVDLLTGPNWLNDQVMAFYCEYLAREAHPSNADAVLLLPPATTYFILNSGRDSAACVLEPLRFATRRLALCCVNDNPDSEAAGGGSHWSLLAYWAATNTFYHYDSCSGINRAPARALWRALQPFVAPDSVFAEQPTPPQRNAYDCGVCVLAATALLCGRFARDGGGMDFGVRPQELTPAAATNLRRDLLLLITDKAAAQAQARAAAAAL